MAVDATGGMKVHVERGVTAGETFKCFGLILGTSRSIWDRLFFQFDFLRLMISKVWELYDSVYFNMDDGYFPLRSSYFISIDSHSATYLLWV